MYKAVGSNIIVKFLNKSKSSIDLSAANISPSLEKGVEVCSVGSLAKYGLEPGDVVMLKPNTPLIVVDETEDYDLYTVPETAVAYVQTHV